MTCPKCGSSDLRHSSSPGWGDAFQRVLGRDAYRCRGCRRRFYASSSNSRSKALVPPTTSKRSKRLLKASARKRLARLAVTVLIFAVAFGIFWVILRYFMAPKISTEDTGAVRTYQVRIPS